MWRAKSLPILLYAISLVGFSSSAALAQTIPDNTLGSESSTVNQDETIGDTLVDLIEGGATRGKNLFHSFSEFNVGDGSAVYFANPNGIANILTRITGNNPSEIFGTLGVDGTANLFLLNPNGIVFGENAALDLNGSFLATTADSYIFENGFEYSASNPKAPPLLTVNMPIGLQFGKKAEAIEVRGTGNNISRDPETFEPIWDARTKGLEVDTGNTLALIGGEINLTGGNLTASQGRIELASIAEKGNLSLISTDNGFSLDSQENANFKDINLTQSASIDTSGNGSGNLQLQGENISLLDGSAIITRTLGDDNGGEVKIKATNSLNIAGANAESFYSSIINNVEAGATGNGGNLLIAANNIELSDANVSNDTRGTGKGGNLIINADNLQIKDGGQIGAATWNDGDSGNIFIKATNVEISGVSSSEISYFSGIYTSAIQSEPDRNVTGNGGNLTIDAERLVVRDGGVVTSYTQGEGNAGDLTVYAAESLEISGTAIFQDPRVESQFNLLSSGLFASVEAGATGNGGSLSITTGNLNLSEGGTIVANTLGSGNAGNILIRVNNLEVKDTVVNSFGTRSGISSSVESSGANNGGNIEIIADNLSLLDGGLAAANALGQGNAGNINIDAQNIDITGVSSGKPVFGVEQSMLPSQVSAFSQGNFNAGSININTNSLNVSDRGDISVSNSGNGNSGELNIIAKELNLDNYAILEAKVNAGSQGNIRLTTDNIFLNNYSLVTAKAKGKATGGNITINNTDNIVLLENSQIIADAEEGNGGNIEITTQGYFVSGDSLVSASSEFGLDGNINVENINGDRPLELDQLPANLVDRTQQIAKSCGVGTNQFAIAGRGGLPENPWQNLRGQSVWQDLRLTAINSNNTNQVQAEQPSTLALEAQAWKINNQGQIELIAIGADARRLDNQAGCQ
jgi:filamentous hemagglutinin family protein